MMLKMEKEIEMENCEACLVHRVFDDDENVYRFGLGSSKRRMLCFQYFSTLPSAWEVYNALFEIHHPNIARPTHVFSQREKNKTKYIIGLDLGTGTSLYEFAKDEKNKKLFFNAREDGTFYSVSDFYTTIISGLINGMNELDETKIKALLKLEHIHIVYDPEDRRKSREEKDVGVRCVFKRYSLRNQDAKRLAQEEKGLAKPEWKELGTLLEELNNILWGSARDKAWSDNYFDPAQEMDLLINILTKRIRSKVEQILDHPIFYSWRRRISLILHTSEILKHFENEMKTNSYLDWNDSIISPINIMCAFEDPHIITRGYADYIDGSYCERKINSHPCLAKYKASADAYANAKKRERDRAAGLKGMRDEVMAHAMQFVSLYDCAQRRRIATACIRFMRNTLTHYLSMQNDLDKQAIIIKTPKEIEFIPSALSPGYTRIS